MSRYHEEQMKHLNDRKKRAERDRRRQEVRSIERQARRLKKKNDQK